MTARLNDREFILFRDYISEQCGILLGDDKAYLIESRLSRLMVENGLFSFEELYKHIYSHQDRQMAARVIDAVTTNETLWFRDRAPWIIMEKHILPAWIDRLRQGKCSRARIWSAACSTGQEPYSLAMLIDNYLARNNIKDLSLKDFAILATDISATVLQIAAKGRYDNISIMRGLDQYYRDRYFKQEGRTWTLDDRILGAVEFRQFNLQDSYTRLGVFDTVYMRNVLIYFSKELKRDIIQRVSGSLSSGGYFIVGAAEIMSDYCQLFDQKELESGVVYQLKG